MIAKSLFGGGLSMSGCGVKCWKELWQARTLLSGKSRWECVVLLMARSNVSMILVLVCNGVLVGGGAWWFLGAGEGGTCIECHVLVFGRLFLVLCCTWTGL